MKFLEIYHKRKGHLYYKIAQFAFTISLTVLTVVFGINAEVFKQYSEESNYSWFNLIDILRFSNDHLQLHLSPKPSIIKIDLENKKSLSKLNYWFIVDRTSSTLLSDINKNYMNPVIEEIISDIISNINHSNHDKALRNINELELRSLSIQELICLRMLLSFYEGANRTGDTITVGVAFYDGIKERYEKRQHFNYLGLDSANKTGFISKLIIKEETEKAEFYGKILLPFINGPHRTKKFEYEWTNFEIIFQELKERIQHNNDSTIITIISDFHHEEQFPSKDDNIFSARFAQVEETLERMVEDYSQNISQLNLVRIPKKKLKEKELKEINSLIRLIKSNFNYTYYYEIDALSLVRENDILAKTVEIIAPTKPLLEKDAPITFYYPYKNNLGNTSVARANISFEPSSSENQRQSFTCYMSLLSKQDLTSSTNVQLNIKFNDVQGREHSRSIWINNYLSEDFPIEKDIHATFNNSMKTQNFGDLALNVFPKNSNYKIRYPITLKEKIPILNAQILGFSAIITITSLILYLLFLIGDLLFNKDENNNLTNNLNLNNSPASKPEKEKASNILQLLVHDSKLWIITLVILLAAFVTNIFIWYLFIDHLGTNFILFTTVLILISCVFFFLYGNKASKRDFGLGQDEMAAFVIKNTERNANELKDIKEKLEKIKFEINNSEEFSDKIIEKVDERIKKNNHTITSKFFYQLQSLFDKYIKK